MSGVAVVVRSAIFFLLQAVLTVLWSFISLLTFPFRPMTRYRVITLWSRAVVWLASVICGVRYQVWGLERLPSRPSIALAKHQSAWETLAGALLRLGLGHDEPDRHRSKRRHSGAQADPGAGWRPFA
jgi:1-acyl-sn-glycerol-3-phosphate acyltransferase